MFSTLSEDIFQESQYNNQVEDTKIFRELNIILKCFHIYRGDIGYIQSMCRLVYVLYIIHRN